MQGTRGTAGGRGGNTVKGEGKRGMESVGREHGNNVGYKDPALKS